MHLGIFGQPFKNRRLPFGFLSQRYVAKHRERFFEDGLFFRSVAGEEVEDVLDEALELFARGCALDASVSVNMVPEESPFGFGQRFYKLLDLGVGHFFFSRVHGKLLDVNCSN